VRESRNGVEEYYLTLLAGQGIQRRFQNYPVLTILYLTEIYPVGRVLYGDHALCLSLSEFHQAKVTLYGEYPCHRFTLRPVQMSC
jgi:hypothetical protein